MSYCSRKSEGCQNGVEVTCSCTGSSMQFCTNHPIRHSYVNNCSITKEFRKMKFKDQENALDSLVFEIINYSRDMIEEINQEVSSITDIIEKIKLNIINPNNEQISELIDFANSTIFSSIISNFFDVDNNEIDDSKARCYASKLVKIIEKKNIEYTKLNSKRWAR